MFHHNATDDIIKSHQHFPLEAVYRNGVLTLLSRATSDLQGQRPADCRGGLVNTLSDFDSRMTSDSND